MFPGLNSLRRNYAPNLDPPGEETVISKRRKLTRDRTPWHGPDEYICTVDCDLTELKKALRAAGYRPNHFSTLKYVETSDGLSWERLSMATNKWNPFGGECQQHTYVFQGGDNTLHLHHHREYPIVRPVKHQSGSRTHRDIDRVLRDALEKANIAFRTVDDQEYKPTKP